MVWQYGKVEHVRIGQNVGGIVLCPVALGCCRIPVDGRNRPTRRAKLGRNPKLIVGQRLSGGQVESGSRSPVPTPAPIVTGAWCSGGQYRQQVSQRLSGRRPARQRDVVTSPRRLCRRNLVQPRSMDSGVSERTPQYVREPGRP